MGWSIEKKVKGEPEMEKSIETVFRELYNCEFPDTPDSLIMHQELKRKLYKMDVAELEKQRFHKNKSA